ncbi:MAG: BTAD domain-containing putative transcriptional regulator [bacterium]
MSGAFEILRTKVKPPHIGVSLIDRARLTSVIHEALQRKLLLLSAEAGYGKTSLLLSALPELPLPVAWLTLDDGDADPNLLVAGLVAAIREVVPDFGEQVLEVLRTGPSPAALRSGLLRGLEDAPPLALVMDDFHVVDGRPGVTDLLDALLLSLPTTVHMLIASRTWPQLQTLPRLLVAEEAIVLDKARLSFTPEETAHFLRHSHGLSVRQAEVRQLADRTEGWPAALQLVALASKACGTVAVEGTPREIFDYLAATVVGTLTPQLQEFLLRTSILAELWPSLCRSLVDDGDPVAILRELDHKNIFLYRLDEAGPRYRYHQLFAEFLQQQLAQRGSAAVGDLHGRAGRQLEAEGVPEQAVRHYIAAEAYEDAERVMKPLHGDRLTAKLAYVFRDIVTRLPVHVQEEYPWMTRCGASASRFVGDYQRGLVFAQRAMKAAEGKDLNLWAFAVHGSGVMYSCMDRYEEAITVCRPALARLDESVEPRMRTGIVGIMADCNIQLGDLTAAEALVPHLQTVSTQSAQPGKGLARSYLSGLIAAARLEYLRAAEHFQQSLHEATERGSLSYQVLVLTELARTQLALRDVTTAVDTLSQAEGLHKQTGERVTDLALTYLVGDACALNGDLERAAQAYQQALDKCRDGESQEPRLWALLGLTRVARARGNLREAESLLGTALQLCRRTGLGKILPLLRIQEIGLLRTAGRPDEALQLLPALRETFTRWGSPPGLARCAILEAQLRWDLTGSNVPPEAARTAAAQALRLAASCMDDVCAFVQAEAGWTVPLLIQALHRNIEPQIAEELLLRLGRLAVDPLIAGLRHAALRSRSIALLGRLGDPEARRPLTRLLTDRDLKTRASARRALEMLREPEAPRLYFRLLGRFEVVRNGEGIEDRAWKTQKVKTLCKYLLMHRTRGVHQEQLSDLLWPNAGARAGAVNLKTAVKHLRQVLEPLQEGTRSHFVQRDREMIRLVVPERCWVDVDEYDRLLADARRDEAAGTTATTAITALEQAVALYRGDLLEEDLYDDWLALERERRREMHIGTLEELAHLYERRKDYRRAIDTLQRVLALDRLREATYRAVIRCHLLRGDRAGAVRIYRLCEQLLREELGVPPQPETTALIEQAAPST